MIFMSLCNLTCIYLKYSEVMNEYPLLRTDFRWSRNGGSGDPLIYIHCAFGEWQDIRTSTVLSKCVG